MKYPFLLTLICTFLLLRLSIQNPNQLSSFIFSGGGHSLVPVGVVGAPHSGTTLSRRVHPYIRHSPPTTPPHQRSSQASSVHFSNPNHKPSPSTSIAPEIGRNVTTPGLPLVVPAAASSGPSHSLVVHQPGPGGGESAPTRHNSHPRGPFAKTGWGCNIIFLKLCFIKHIFVYILNCLVG